MKTYSTYIDAMNDFDDDVLTEDEFDKAVAALPPGAVAPGAITARSDKPSITLRSRIQTAIESHKDNPVEAAFAVCRVLERQIGLAGNGWWDDDPELQQRWEAAT